MSLSRNAGQVESSREVALVAHETKILIKLKFVIYVPHAQ